MLAVSIQINSSASWSHPPTMRTALMRRCPIERTFRLRVCSHNVSKACADEIARSFAATYGLPLAVTRLGNVYGGGDPNWSRVVPDTARALIEGRRPVIRS